MTNYTWKNVTNRYHSLEFDEDNFHVLSKHTYQSPQQGMNRKKAQQGRTYYGGSNDNVFFETMCTNENNTDYILSKGYETSGSYSFPVFDVMNSSNTSSYTNLQPINSFQTHFSSNSQQNPEIRQNMEYINSQRISNSINDCEVNIHGNLIHEKGNINDSNYSNIQTDDFSQIYMRNSSKKILSPGFNQMQFSSSSNMFNLSDNYSSEQNCTNAFNKFDANINHVVPHQITLNSSFSENQPLVSGYFSNNELHNQDHFSQNFGESYLRIHEMRDPRVRGQLIQINDDHNNYAKSTVNREIFLDNYTYQDQIQSSHNSNINKRPNYSKRANLDNNKRRQSFSHINKRSNPYKNQDRTNLGSFCRYSAGKSCSRVNSSLKNNRKIRDRCNEMFIPNNYSNSNLQRKLVNDRSFPTHFITDFREFGLRKELDLKIDNMLPKIYVDKALIAYDEFVRVLNTISSFNITSIRPGLLLTSLPNCDSCSLYKEVLDHYKSQNLANFFLMIATFPESGMCKGWAVILLESKDFLMDFLISSHFQWRGICVKVKPLLNIDLFFFNFKFINMFTNETCLSQYDIVQMNSILNFFLKNETLLNYNVSMGHTNNSVKNENLVSGEPSDLNPISTNNFNDECGNFLNSSYGGLEKIDTFFFSGKDVYLCVPSKKALKFVSALSSSKGVNSKKCEEVQSKSKECEKRNFVEKTGLLKYDYININNIENCFRTFDAEHTCSKNNYDFSGILQTIPEKMNVFPWGIKYNSELKNIDLKDLSNRLRCLIRRLHKSCNHKWNLDMEYEGFIDDYLHIQGIKQLISNSKSDLISGWNENDQKSKIQSFTSQSECADIFSLDFVLCVRGIPNLPKYNLELKIRKLLESMFDSIQKTEKSNMRDFWSVELYIFPETERFRGDGIVLLPSYCNSSTFFSKIPIKNILEKPNFKVGDQLDFWILPYNMYISQIKEELSSLLKLFARLISFWSYHVNGKRHPLKTKNKSNFLESKTNFSDHFDSNKADLDFTSRREHYEVNQDLSYKLLGYKDVDLENLNLVEPPINRIDEPDVNGTLLGVEATAEQWLNGLPKLVAEGIDERALDCSVMHFVKTFFFSAENFLSIYPFNSWLQLVPCEESSDRFENASENLKTNNLKDDLQKIIRHPLPNQSLTKNVNHCCASAKNIIAEIITQDKDIKIESILDNIINYVNFQFGNYFDSNECENNQLESEKNCLYDKVEFSILNSSVGLINRYGEIEYVITEVKNNNLDVSYECKLTLKRWKNMGIEWNSGQYYKDPKASVTSASINLLKHFAVLEYRNWLISAIENQKKIDPSLNKRPKLHANKSFITVDPTTSEDLKQNSLSKNTSNIANTMENNYNLDLFLNTISREALSIADKFEGIWNVTELQKTNFKVRCVALPSSLSFEESQKLISLEYLMRLIKAERMRLVPLSTTFRTPLYRKNAYRYVQERFRCDPSHSYSHLDHLWSNRCHDIVANSIDLFQGKIFSWLFLTEDSVNSEAQDILIPEFCLNFLVNYCHYKQ